MKSSRAVALNNHPVNIAAQRADVNPSLIVQRRKGWVKVNEEAACRMCRRAKAVRPLTRHHIVPQSYFREHRKIAPLRHADANIVPLCHSCHRLVERASPHARIELRRSLYPSEIAFAIQVAGQAWLDLRYPQGGARHSVGLSPEDEHIEIMLRVSSSPGTGSSA